MNPTTGWLVAGVSLLNILACVWLIWATSRRKPNEVAEGAVKEDVWDGDLRELNNPLPRWWLNLFIITIVFAIGYMVVFPGFGHMAGVLDWSKRGEMESKLAQLTERREAKLNELAAFPVAEIASHPDARKVGQELFGSYCAGCHGANAEGARGYPNLTDDDWLYGGTPQAVVASITNGRGGVMTPFLSQLSNEQVSQLIALVADWPEGEPSGRQAEGMAVFRQRCAACHGMDGHGNQALGAPDLTDDTWLYGGDPDTIRETILFGRQGKMPSHKALLSEQEIKLLAGYVIGLGQ
ncbi:cytochrome-c oxidase, cbb3-type subunit III [uncultured Abyssibacter sp.]|uniref:cytochrome-c oxidase, cbb3-type subunit III n=1 Tax=uncultured Abyssibacter sp. TaxID=2320202 RepID=UPI0032B1E9C6